MKATKGHRLRNSPDQSQGNITKRQFNSSQQTPNTKKNQRNYKKKKEKNRDSPLELVRQGTSLSPESTVDPFDKGC